VAVVRIRRFKQIDEVTLQLDQDPTILVGANNSGKSSILHAIHFAASVAQTSKLVGEDLFWRTDRFELSLNPTQLLWSPVSDALSLASGGDLSEDRTRQIEITLQDTSGNSGVVAVRRGRNRNISVSLRGRALGEKLQDLARPFSVYTPGLAGIAREERYLSPGVVRRAVARGDANLVLRNVLLMLHTDQDKWHVFLRDIQSLFPGINFQVRYDENTDETITTNVTIDGSPYLPLDAAGTAVLQATQILGYSVLYNPPLVLLDEPDSHLHPNNQRSLCQLLTNLSRQRGFRVIISTHSRHVLDALRGHSSVVWLSHGAVVPDTAESLTSRLLDLGALDSIDFFADSQARCAVLTEDGESEPLEALLWSSGFVEEDTKVASYDGCSRVDAAIVLGQFLEQHAPSVQVLVHRDRDYMSTDEAIEYERQISNCGLMTFITESNDIEWYFINANHLASINVGISAAQIESMIDAVLTDTKDKSVEVMTNIRVERARRAQARTGSQPNVGEIAANARREYEADPRRHCRGAVVIGPLIARMQQAMGANPAVYEPSAHLKCDALAELAHGIWNDPQS
jgi:energy-coupling factor transporter ATP-binding protein EcfA2